jgi:hypothetical protein
MANTKVVEVTVEELTKYGYKANGKYVNYSKQFNESDKANIVPGVKFSAEYYIADSGKEYLNKIVSFNVKDIPKAVEKKEVSPQVDPERAKKFTPKFQKKDAIDNSMSKAEWAAKDHRISRQGAIQAAVQALAPVVGLDNLLDEAVKLSEGMLNFVNKAE